MAPTFNGMDFASPSPVNDTPAPTYSDIELVVASYRARAEQLKAYDDAKSSLLQVCNVPEWFKQTAS